MGNKNKGRTRTGTESGAAEEDSAERWGTTLKPGSFDLSRFY
jgi:hypothetical protein